MVHDGRVSLVLGAAAVVFLNLYAAALVILRARVWGVPLYRPMLLNIGLSVAPVASALLLPVARGTARRGLRAGLRPRLGRAHGLRRRAADGEDITPRC